MHTQFFIFKMARHKKITKTMEEIMSLSMEKILIQHSR